MKSILDAVVLGALLLSSTALAVPVIQEVDRDHNMRATPMALRIIRTAEADFRSNDRDGNLLNDFWTGDVSGLWLILTQPPDGGAPEKLDIRMAIKLIEPAIARADAQSAGNGGRYIAAQHVPYAEALKGKFEPRNGYWFKAMSRDRTGDKAPFTELRWDTDGDANKNWGACHNIDRFAFIAFPADLKNGTVTFIVNQDSTIYQSKLGEKYTARVGGLPGGPTETTLLNTGFGFLDGKDTQDFPDAPTAKQTANGGGFEKLD